MTQTFSCIVEMEQYTTKTLADNTIKINPHTSDTYRTLVRYMRENNIIHHTYQLREQRAFRVVIKHLHFSTNIKDIEQDLNKVGHTVRNITNVLSRQTRAPLNIFFVDLEPAANNKDIYNITHLQNQIIEIEPPRKTRGIPQCMRCQQYGHTKTYCFKPFACVKCGGSHSTQSCKKPPNTPAKCALCGGAHPANYRGCERYLSLLRKPSNTNNRHNIQLTPATQIQPTQVNPGLSYSGALLGKKLQDPHAVNSGVSSESTRNDLTPTPMLSNFLEEFKIMFQQLTHQNSMILNMLSTLVSKLH
jgi:hypothetical protein